MQHQPTDAELHELVAAGDEPALALWQARTGSEILRLVANAGLGPADAEEIWNEAFFATWARLQREPALVPIGEGLRAYVFKVANNLIAQRRAQSALLETVELLEEHDEIPSRPGSEPASELVQALRRCLESAPARVRLVAELLMEQISREQFATALNIAATSVGQTVARAKAKLIECVEGARS
ncbi:MAG TPA: sigma-70 family RNA polymerase sigma factor [Candidatus Limnocylindrales bacterium]|nr:sigma-70 family RNA polymerase sigma factor [Candidatus Limnocylindrales bacterium]